MSLTKALPLLRPRPQCFARLPSPRTYAYYPRGPNSVPPPSQASPTQRFDRPAYSGSVQRDPRLYVAPSIPDTYSEAQLDRTRASENRGAPAPVEDEQWPENYLIPTSHDGLVQLIDEDGRRIGPRNLREQLAEMDLNTYVIKMVSFHVSPTDGPFVRIYNRDKLEQHERELAQREKERVQEAKQEAERYKKEVKELKISWGIGEHDLGIKMKKAKEFLEHGKRVHVTLAIKKKMARVELSQMKDLVERIQNMIHEFGGEEYKPMDGTIGRMAELKFRPAKKKTKKAESSTTPETSSVDPESINLRE